MRLRILLLTLSIVALVAAVGWTREVSSMAAHQNESAYAELPALATLPGTSATSTVSTSIPILVYHIVRPHYASDSAAVRALALTPEIFDAELTHLSTSGYHAVGFQDLEAYFASSTPLPDKPVVVSFDDGWSDQFKYAFPILQKHHVPATFFVFTNAINHPGFFTWSNLQTMSRVGMTIGDHTRSHPYLIHIKNVQQLWSEIDGSKKILEKNLGIPVTAFAYPFGQYNSAIVGLVQKAGFTSARGDYWSGNTQTPDMLYTLSAMNAPTTTAAFIARLP